MKELICRGTSTSHNGTGPAGDGSTTNPLNGATLPHVSKRSLPDMFTASTLQILRLIEREAIHAPQFENREDLLGRVAVANLVKANGDTKIAAATAGILEGQLKHWVQRAEKERDVPGLFAALTSEAEIAAMTLPPRIAWPPEPANRTLHK